MKKICHRPTRTNTDLANRRCGALFIRENPCLSVVKKQKGEYNKSNKNNGVGYRFN